MSTSTKEIVRHGTNDRMSKAIVHGDTVYLCGQVGIAGESIEKQTQEALDRVEMLLQSVGSNKEKLLQVTVWLSDMSYFDAMNTVWENWLPKGKAPTRACGEAKLARPDLYVEFICIAAA